MTQDEIIEMARQAQQESFVGDKGHWFKMELKDLERFVKLVAAKEREACAKVCEEHGKVWAERMLLGFQATLDDAAKAIRARGEA